MTRFGKPIAVLDAPSNLGLRPPGPGRVPGVARLPAALREHGLLPRLQAGDAGAIQPPAYHPDPPDPRVGIRNAPGVRAVASDLAAHLQPLLDAGTFPLVLGGDCSILLGIMLGLRRRGHFGLCVLDGHTDFLTPATSQTGGAAGMDVALVTGHGPDVLTDFDGLRPLVQPADVVVCGYRDVDDPATYPGRAIFTTAIHRFDLHAVRQLGVRPLVEAIGAILGDAALDGFWLHLDADVLHDEWMPAVDSRQPDGLTAAELIECLQRLLAIPGAIGMDITIFDPDRDPDGQIGAAFTSAIVEAFMGAEH
jgi:arginase